MNKLFTKCEITGLASQSSSSPSSEVAVYQKQPTQTRYLRLPGQLKNFKCLKKEKSWNETQEGSRRMLFLDGHRKGQILLLEIRAYKKEKNTKQTKRLKDHLSRTSLYHSEKKHYLVNGEVVSCCDYLFYNCVKDQKQTSHLLQS